MKRFYKSLGIFGVLGLLGSVGLNIFQFSQNRQLEQSNTVMRVVDGDTFVIGSGESIRLGNLNAPELGNCGSLEAKKKLENLILGKTVKIEFYATDKFSRSVSLVYQGNKLINEEILKAGWARYDSTSDTKKDILKSAYDYAYNNKIGIFSSLCRSETSDDPKCLIKGNIERNSNKKFYFFPGCSNYSITIIEKDLGESWFCSEAEAIKAGYTKAHNCYSRVYK